MTHAEDSDARLLAAEAMSRSLAGHPGATPGMRRLAEALVEALRRTTEDRWRVEAGVAPRTGQDAPPTASPTPASVDELDARASELLSVLAVLHGVIVRRDEGGAARVLVEAERTLSQLQALEGGARLLEGDE